MARPCNCAGRRRGTTKRVEPKGTKNDGKATSYEQSFVLHTPAGKTQKFNSRLEADAARVRAGGGVVRRS